MKKPDRVEVGQWWVELDGGAPFRVAHNTPEWNQQAWLSGPFAYLGSGDHPEPSEWMIEQLARVGSRNRRGINEGAALSERDPQYQDDLRSMARSAIEGAFSLAGPSITELVMLETYSILRSLGKW